MKLVQTLVLLSLSLASVSAFADDSDGVITGHRHSFGGVKTDSDGVITGHRRSTADVTNKLMQGMESLNAPEQDVKIERVANDIVFHFQLNNGKICTAKDSELRQDAWNASSACE